MALRGSITTMPVEDVVAWAARHGATGRLVIERDDVARTFWLDRGVAVWATSNVPEEQLGQILLRSGLIDEQALAGALGGPLTTTAGAAGATAFGQLLVAVGAIAETDLATILTTKVREALCEVVAWTEGTFDFEPVPPPAAGRVAVGVELTACLELARARAARWAEIRARIPGDGVGFVVRDPAAAVISATGRVDGRRLIEVLVAGGSAGDAIAALAGERFATLDVLADLLAAGAIELDPAGGKGDLAHARPRQLVEAVERRLEDGDRAGALALAAQALALHPADAEVRAAYKDAERARAAELARALLSRHRVPALRRSPAELDALELTDVERRLVSRVDGRWDLLTLVRTSPFGDVATLLAFAALAERGIVALS